MDEQPTELKQAYQQLDHIYKKYLDLNPHYYPILNTWTLSALFHDAFPTFPFLFLNAMKGSGKSRFLKLAANLTDGIYTTSLTPAVLFRTNGSLFIDEVESISSKEKNDLRELLNAAYKKGLHVMRAKKIEKTGETVIDKFEPYRAAALANINGIDDVLEDRCIKLTVERSFNAEITRRMELFEFDKDVKRWSEMRNRLISLAEVEWQDGAVVSFGVGMEQKKVYKEIVELVFQYYNDVTVVPTPNLITTPNITSTYTLTTTPNNTSLDNFSNNERTATLIYNKIQNTTLQGRDLELWYPLLITAALIDEKLLTDLVETAQDFSADKSSVNVTENNDIVLIGFLHGFLKDFKEGQYIPLNSIVNSFHLSSPNEDKWFNAKWLAHAFERNKLVLKKRRMRGGREVIMDFAKVAERARLFGVEDDGGVLK